ncbi:MAG: Tad domain-containing protein [Actinomycetota bacterium]|nr:Tad domain-containing protein [Actinomycetota bacterium]
MNRREEGTITVMVVGFFVVIGLLAVVVINASAAFLQRQELNNVADGAALAATDGLRQETIYREGIDEDAPIDPRRARELVAAYLSATTTDLSTWSVSTDNDTVRVHLDRSITLPLAPPGWFGTSLVTADAAALLRVER